MPRTAKKPTGKAQRQPRQPRQQSSPFVAEETISFKADAELARVLKSLRNRSDFIRQAIRHAVYEVCPLCHGTGYLKAPTPRRRQSRATR